MEQLGEVGHRVEGLGEVTKQRRRGAAGCFEHPGQEVETGAETLQLPRGGESEADPRRQPFEVGQVFQGRAQVLEQAGVVHQFGYRTVAFGDLLEVDTGPHQAVAQQP